MSAVVAATSAPRRVVARTQAFWTAPSASSSAPAVAWRGARAAVPLAASRAEGGSLEGQSPGAAPSRVHTTVRPTAVWPQPRCGAFLWAAGTRSRTQVPRWRGVQQLAASSCLRVATRQVAVLTQGPSPGSGGSDGSGGAGGSEGTTQSEQPENMVKKVAVLALKGLCIWAPAVVFWIALAMEGNMLELRTPEEIEDDDAEARRLERFYDVEQLPNDQYIGVWTAKDEALGKILEKLVRSQRFLNCMATGSSEEPDRAATATEAGHLEISYVMPPAVGVEALTSQSAAGPRPWQARLVIANHMGALCLVNVCFQHVAGSKDRDERWACTHLRGDLISNSRGEPMCEMICDLSGPVPHGVQYVRI